MKKTYFIKGGDNSNKKTLNTRIDCCAMGLPAEEVKIKKGEKRRNKVIAIN